jgi:hypothetical protein
MLRDTATFCTYKKIREPTGTVSNMWFARGTGSYKQNLINWLFTYQEITLLLFLLFYTETVDSTFL